jgi:hypothetical protein
LIYQELARVYLADSKEVEASEGAADVYLTFRLPSRSLLPPIHANPGWCNAVRQPVQAGTQLLRRLSHGTFSRLCAYLKASGENMCNYTPVENKGLARFFLLWSLLSAFALVGICLISQPCSAQEPEKEGMGVIVSSKASAEDVGLPLYPGSKPHKDESNDSQAARLGLWGRGSGFKLALVKMDTGDSPERVAAFYKKALSKYGKVLDCSNPSPVKSGAEKRDSSKTLACGDDKPEKGGMLFKSGTKEKQHIVAIQPTGQGSLYQLVALSNWSSDDKN